MEREFFLMPIYCMFILEVEITFFLIPIYCMFILEVEITCGHRSISVHYIVMTDHKYTQSVSVTARVFFLRLRAVHAHVRGVNGARTGLERGKNGARTGAPVRLPVRTGACIG